MSKSGEEYAQLEQQAIDDGEDLMMAEQNYYDTLSNAASLVANDEKAMEEFLRLVFKYRN